MNSYRYMRSIIMFDLPTLTATDRRNYRKFVKLLKKNGFIMFQESIYVKLSINEQAAKNTAKTIRNNVPPKGMVSMLTVTERQFNSMEYMLGEFITNVINTDEKIIEL